MGLLFFVHVCFVFLSGKGAGDRGGIYPDRTIIVALWYGTLPIHQQKIAA